MKVSLPQVAAKTLPMEAARSTPTSAGLFSAALADAGGVSDAAGGDVEAVVSSHGHKGDNVKAQAKDEKKSSGRSLPADKPAIPVPITVPTTIIPTIAKPGIGENTLPVTTADKGSSRRAVSSTLPPTARVNFRTVSLSQVPVTVAPKLSFDELLQGQGSRQVSRPIEAIEPHQAQPDKQSKVAQSTKSYDVIQKEDAGQIAFATGIPATPSSPGKAAAELIAAAIPTPAGAPVAKETRATHTMLPAEAAQSITAGVSQKSSSIPQPHSADLAHAINKAVNPSTPASRESGWHDLPHGEQESSVKKEALRTASVTSQGSDRVNHAFQHSKSEITAGPGAGIQGQAENATAAPAKPEVAASAQPALHAVDSREFLRGNTEKITAPSVSGPTHPVPAAHLNTDEGSVIAPISAVHAAKLVERLGQSELRVGLHAGEFGKVNIRTSLGRNQFTAEISVERGELGRVLSAELPNLHTRLAEQHLPTANITVQHYSAGASTDQHDSRQSRSFTPMNLTRGGGEAEASLLPVMGEAMESTTGLDIHM